MFWFIWLFCCLLSAICVAAAIWKEGEMKVEDILPAALMVVLGPLGLMVMVYAWYDGVPKSTTIWKRKGGE